MEYVENKDILGSKVYYSKELGLRNIPEEKPNIPEEEKGVFEPKQVIDEYIDALDRKMISEGLAPNPNYAYVKETLRDLQKNLEKNNMVIKEVKG
jgi:hypothetical protein